MDIIFGYPGGGVNLSDAAAELIEFAHRTNIPVTLTLHGLGAFPGSDRRFIGMLGMHGTYAANQAVNECDCLIAVGDVRHTLRALNPSFDGALDLEPWL